VSSRVCPCSTAVAAALPLLAMDASPAPTPAPTPDTQGAAVAFWDARFSDSSNQAEAAFRRFDRPKSETVHAFMALLGDVNGLNVLDVGCGLGGLTVAVAKRGARVLAVDTAHEGVQRTLALAEEAGVAERVRAEQRSALEVDRLGEQFDLVVGSFILHHVEPFDAFAGVLGRAIRPEGRGLFLENNARNPFLMFARRHLAGRFGIPRFGDDEEHPLEAREVALLRRHFGVVEQHYPDLVFLRKLNTYVIRGRAPWLGKTFHALDRAAYRVPALRPYT